MADEAKVLDVSVLLEQGCICGLSVGRWRAEDRLVASDFGLEAFEDKSFLADFMKLGRRTLLPPDLQKKLNAAESSARKTLQRFTFPTPVGMFCPATAFPSLEAEMEKREKEWYDLRDELVNNLQKHESFVKQAYRTFAKELAERLKRSKRNFPRQYVADKLEGRVPTAQVIKNSFRFEFTAMRIQVPTALGAKVRQQILSEEQTKLELDTVKRRELGIQLMNQRLHERYEAQRKQMLDGFLENVARQVRDTVFEATESVQRSIDKNKQLVGRAAFQLRNLVTWCREMNFLENADLTARIDALDALLKTKPKERKREEVEAAVNGLHVLVKNELLLLELTQQPRQVHDFEFDLPVSPPPPMRKRLEEEFGEVEEV